MNACPGLTPSTCTHTHTHTKNLVLPGSGKCLYPNAWETETRSLRIAWSTYWVGDQPELQGKSPFSLTVEKTGIII